MKYDWPKKPTFWCVDRDLFISIPFTWNLPGVKEEYGHGLGGWDSITVGGPAVRLMPDFFANAPRITVSTGDYPGALQKVNPLATKTSTGCTNHCKFCAVPKMEGKLKELGFWPTNPIVCDNNLLACSMEHFDRVMRALYKLDWCDFNQGVDHRLLTDQHAAAFAAHKKAMVRLSFDAPAHEESFGLAVERLLKHGMFKKNISAYILIGFNDDIFEAFGRCQWVKSLGVNPLPMWFHELDQMKLNIVTDKQKEMGWTNEKRRRIMHHYYGR